MSPPGGGNLSIVAEAREDERNFATMAKARNLPWCVCLIRDPTRGQFEAFPDWDSRWSDEERASPGWHFLF